MWDLVGNPEDRFSHNEAHMSHIRSTVRFADAVKLPIALIAVHVYVPVLKASTPVRVTELSGLTKAFRGGLLPVCKYNSVTELSGLTKAFRGGLLPVCKYNSVTELSGLAKAFRGGLLHVCKCNSATELSGLTKVFRCGLLHVCKCNSATELSGLTKVFRGGLPPVCKYQITNGPVNAHLISWPSKAQNIQNLENIW